MTDGEPVADIVPLPGPSAIELALKDLELVFAFVYARVGNRPDAEDVTQQVALKALPRLKEGSAPSAIRGYLFASARSALAEFWSRRLGIPQEELDDDLYMPEPIETPGGAAERVERILGRLPDHYRRVLELRFLRGYSLKEVAREMGSTVGAVKVMQLRALRRAGGLDEA